MVLFHVFHVEHFSDEQLKKVKWVEILSGIVYVNLVGETAKNPRFRITCSTFKYSINWSVRFKLVLPEHIYNSHYGNLPLSVVQLKGKHCRKPHCRNGVVGTFQQNVFIIKDDNLFKTEILKISPWVKLVILSG